MTAGNSISATQVTITSATTATYSYDNALRMTQVLNQLGSATISQHSYPSLDAVGNRLQVNELVPAVLGAPGQITPVNTGYGYDTLYRLTSVNNGATTYTYDPVGNRLSKSTTSYAYDRADRILSAGSVGFTVNANGNLTARGTDTFAYDQANRLTSATVGGTMSTDVYDGDGKRASRTVRSATTSYVYDVTVSLPNVLTDGTLKYVYGLGLTYAVDGSGNVRVFRADRLGVNSVSRADRADSVASDDVRANTRGGNRYTSNSHRRVLLDNRALGDPGDLVARRADVREDAV